MKIHLISVVLVFGTLPQFGIAPAKIVVGNDSPVYSFARVGPYRPDGVVPNPVKEFREFRFRLKRGVTPHNAELNPEGRLELDGLLLTSEHRFRFTSAFMDVEKKRLVRARFVTETIEGEHWTFEGVFYPTARRNGHTGNHAEIGGTLTKYAHGTKTAEASFDLLLSVTL